MTRQYFTLFSIIAFLLAAVGAVGAQEPAPESTVITGTAVNASPDEIVVKTAGGEEVFLIDKEELYPEPISEGTEVTVWFVERGGYNYATKLAIGNQVASTTGADPMATDEQTEESYESADTMATDETADTGTDYGAADQYGDTLPGTASYLPLLSLLGLLGLLGAAGLWQIRK